MPKSHDRGPSATVAARRVWWPKVRAVLISGIVLGVGATGTLASWTDSVYGSGTVASGSFILEGNSTHPDAQVGSPWGDYSTPATPATFACRDYDNGNADTAVDITPGNSAYCAISLRTKTTNAPGIPANVTLSGASYTANALTNVLTYTVREIINPNDRNYCDSAKWGLLSTIPGYPSDVPLNVGSTQSKVVPVNTNNAGANFVHFCFKITVPSNAPAGALGISTGLITWYFTGTGVYS